MNSCASSPIHVRRCIAAAILMVFAGRLLQSQNAPIQRIFYPKTSISYRVRLSMRTEVEGQRTEKIGEVTYAIPFHRAAESRLGWNVKRRVLSVSAEGEAQIEESLTEFNIAPSPANGASDTGNEDQAAKDLEEALRRTLAQWAQPRTITYRESPSGQVRDLPREAGPALGETGVPLLTLWLLRALRPGIALPARPLRIGDRWQEPRAMQLANWSDVSAAETGEWLEAQQHPESAVRLHIVQQISGQAPSARTPRAESLGGASEERPATEVNFHAESLNTISLQDGRLLAATRSGVHEVTRMLEPVPGLPEAPRFRATISVQVEIEGCDDASCTSSGGIRP